MKTTKDITKDITEFSRVEIHEDKAVFRSGSLTVETSRYTTAADGSLAETSLYTWLRALVTDDSETVDVNGVELARDAMTLMTESCSLNSA